MDRYRSYQNEESLDHENSSDYYPDYYPDSYYESSDENLKHKAHVRKRLETLLDKKRLRAQLQDDLSNDEFDFFDDDFKE